MNEAIRVNKNSAEEYEVVNVQVKDRSAAIFVGCFREKASEAEQLLHTGMASIFVIKTIQRELLTFVFWNQCHDVIVQEIE